MLYEVITYTFTTITNTAGAVIATTASSATFTNAGAGTITIQTSSSFFSIFLPKL